MKILRAILTASVIATLTACQSTPQVANEEATHKEVLPKWENAAYRYTPVAQADSLFVLSPQQQQEFLSYYYSPEKQDVSPNFRLSAYLEKLVEHFSYVGETFTASEALDNKSGNCLSLAILTTALARLVGLDVYYQQVHTPPLYRRVNGVLTTTTHVRSHVLGPKLDEEGRINLYRSKVIIDYFPTASNDVGDYLTENAFISMYYQNMAARAMANDNANLAYSFLSEAMNIDPTNYNTINTLAVLYRMGNHLDKARSLYEYALEYDHKSIHTLNNFAVLLTIVNDQEMLEKIDGLYLKVDDSNPYRWYDIGNQALSKGEHQRAEVFFRRTIKEGPYLSEGYFGLAKVFYLSGDLDQAANNMEKALSLSFPSDNRGLYAAKLEALQRSRK